MNLTNHALKILGAFGLVIAACSAHVEAAVPDVQGTVRADGSSTVFPISEAVAEEFQKEFTSVNVTVGVSGTGGGFKKFVSGEIDVVNASRPIKQSEIEAAEKNGISFLEIPIAYDALSIVVNPKNTWLKSITVKELSKMWAPEAQGKVMKWSDVRSDWPAQPLELYGPGVDSGTYDYFTEAIIGKEDASRGDYTNSEDDNVLVKGVAGSQGALGFMGVAYYENNSDKLKVIPVDDEKDDNGKGPQLPTAESVIAGTYAPLARPLFIYARKEALDRPEVREFVAFYLKNAKSLASEVGYIALPDQTYAMVQQRVEQKVAGSLFGGKGHQVGVSLQDLMKMGKSS